MKRRTILGIIGSFAFVVVALCFAGDNEDFNNDSTNNELVEYTPGLIKKELAAGKTVFVIYASDWCVTCIRQERTIKKIRSSNPLYDQNMTFIRVDWSDYGEAEVTTSRNIPRRSTLLILKGNKELGRNVAGTDANKIKALLDLDL